MLRAEESEIGDTVLKSIMVGDEAAAVRKYLHVRYPIENGIVQDWTDMEVLELRLRTNWVSRMPTVRTENSSHGSSFESQKESKSFANTCSRSTTTILFRYRLKLCLLCMLKVFLLVLYWIPVTEDTLCMCIRGLRTGTCDPTIESHVVTRHKIFDSTLQLRGYSFNSTADFETVRQIKEDLCYVALDYRRRTSWLWRGDRTGNQIHASNGSIIKVGRERFQALGSHVQTRTCGYSQRRCRET